jgi:hypothetical protein
MRGVDGGHECTVGEHECAADGSSALPRQFTYPFMRRRVDSDDDEMVDVMVPLLHC